MEIPASGNRLRRQYAIVCWPLCWVVIALQVVVVGLCDVANTKVVVWLVVLGWSSAFMVRAWAWEGNVWVVEPQQVENFNGRESEVSEAVAASFKASGFLIFEKEDQISN